ncbi:helix-turn-helix domain-containing protein [Lactococcus lactis]|uniref:helix-turn-helix domain-containing protein n=1 Tax=Lactococcus lactis TaxID=1358 RepID=UPI002074273A|nr:helix-turn-helix transcriptional regulator [Lactococcus lactis]
MSYDRLKTLVIDSQKSFNQVERELRYPRNALANYRLGKEPSAKRLTEIADYFNVTTEYLLGKDDKYSYNKAKLLFEYLTLDNKQNLLNYIQNRIDELELLEREPISLSTEQFVFCGDNTWALQESRKTIKLLTKQLPDDYDAVFELVGGPLDAEAPGNGDLLFVKFTDANFAELIHNFLLQHDHFAKLSVKDEKLTCLSRDAGSLAEVPELFGKIAKIYRFRTI